MRKQQILKFSLILSVFSIFIFSFTYFGASAFGSRTSTNQPFSENTYVGNLDVSNKTQDEAKAAIETKINEWSQSANISLLYKGETYSIDPSHFVFLIDESVASAQSGTQNVLIVELKEEALNALPLPDTVSGQLKKELLSSDLQAAAKSLVFSTEISLEKYLQEEEPVTIAKTTLVLPDESGEIKELAEAIRKIEIAPETQFSLASHANEKNLAEKPAYAFSQIASAIYKAILSTNFTVAERHISSKLPDNIELGFEAKVDFAKNLDLKLYNPNKTAYTIELGIVNEELHVTITGAPLLYEYKIAASEKQEFKPRTIKQYSPLLNTGQKSVENEGEPGFLITVSRDIYGNKGELFESEFVSEDFYPPVHRVEIFPVGPAVQQTVPDTNINPGAVTGPVPNQTLPNTVPSVPEGQGATPPEQSSDDTSNQEDIIEDGDTEGGFWGKPNEQPK